MPSSSDRSQAKLESLKRAGFQRLLEDAAELQSKGLLKTVPLQPGQTRPATQQLRVKVPR